MAEVSEIKLFGKWTYEDVEVRTRTPHGHDRHLFWPLGFSSPTRCHHLPPVNPRP